MTGNQVCLGAKFSCLTITLLDRALGILPDTQTNSKSVTQGTAATEQGLFTFYIVSFIVSIAHSLITIQGLGEDFNLPVSLSCLPFGWSLLVSDLTVLSKSISMCSLSTY